MLYQEQLTYHQRRLQAHIDRIVARITYYTADLHWQLYTATSDPADIDEAVKEINDTLKQCFQDIPNYQVAPTNHVIEQIILGRMKPVREKWQNIGADKREFKWCIQNAVDNFFMHLKDEYH